MKIVIKIFTAIIGFVVLVVGLMFAFKACPPQGPWMMPPWCEDKTFERPVYDIDVKTQVLSQTKAVNMADTWGRNYNFSMIENTRNNIESSFDRVKELGAEEVYVHDFNRAVYNHKEEDFASLDYEIVDEIFANDLRDESMTEKDIKKLAKAAHERGLKLGIKQNMAFVDIGKYIKEGLTGEIQGGVEEDYVAFNSEHSEEWIRDYFKKWEARLLERGKLYEKYGVDIISITPNWMGPTFIGQEALANDLQKELIAKLRGVFSGEIHTEIDFWGVIHEGRTDREDWRKYDYYKDADIQEVRVYQLVDNFAVVDGASTAQIKVGIDRLLDRFEQYAEKNEIKMSVFFSPSSYPNAINVGAAEFHDIRNADVAAIQKDWDHQADAWQAFFEAVSQRQLIDRVNVSAMWWDNAMDPDVKVRISISPSVRNKPAEEIIKQWFNQ
ncbi:hypothetical protein KKG38_04755 [Patescibacteria group bacterium]|nr:hypothetical protein [Patescibacteria group bacterium]MBU1901538.1 hypothetical protein [Patescibacteria group bacterium]